MTRPTLIIATALAFSFLAIGGCASRDSASANTGPNRVLLSVNAQSRTDGDEIITLDECPAAVQATIQSHLNGGALKEIERTTDHGEVLYEVDVQNADGVTEFDVAQDGAFRGYETEDSDGGKARDDADDEQEQEIPLANVPQNVISAALAAVPGIVFEEATVETEGDSQVYELEGEANGQDYEIEISADGKVLEVEAGGGDDDDGAAPDDDDGDNDDGG